MCIAYNEKIQAKSQLANVERLLKSMPMGRFFDMSFLDCRSSVRRLFSWNAKSGTAPTPRQQRHKNYYLWMPRIDSC